jgi:hypothetical protein
MWLCSRSKLAGHGSDVLCSNSLLSNYDYGTLMYIYLCHDQNLTPCYAFLCTRDKSWANLCLSSSARPITKRTYATLSCCCSACSIPTSKPFVHVYFSSGAVTRTIYGFLSTFLRFYHILGLKVQSTKSQSIRCHVCHSPGLENSALVVVSKRIEQLYMIEPLKEHTLVNCVCFILNAQLICYMALSVPPQVRPNPTVEIFPCSSSSCLYHPSNHLCSSRKRV